MISYGIKVAQYGLWTLIAVLLVGLGTPFRGGETPEVEFVPLEPIRRAQAAFSRYAVIGNRNLFRVPEGAIPIAPIEEVIEESRLSFKLKGTLAGPDDVASAIVEDARGKTQVVAVADILEGGVRVERIEGGRIVVLNGGKREAINMAEDQAPPSLAMLQSGQRSVATVTVIPPPPPAYVAVASPELVQRMALLATPEPPRARRSAPAPSIAERELPSENNRFPRTLGSRSGVGAAPFSAIAGSVAAPEGLAAASQFQAVAGQPVLDTLLRNVSLRRGEEILAVNGIPVNAAERLPELLRSLMGPTSARVRIAVDSKSEREIEVALR